MITDLTAYHEHEQGYMDCANGLPMRPGLASASDSEHYIKGYCERLLFEVSLPAQRQQVENARDEVFDNWGSDLTAQNESVSVRLKTCA